jgi:anti-sigma regulatory factor (Ser/Thr protein kinase)
MVVGGDFFDFVPMDTAIGIAAGDVCGKGISAALLMVMVRTLLRHVAIETDEPAPVLALLNRALCRDLPASLFVTLTLAVADPERPGHLRISSAGHPRPLHVPAHAGAVPLAAGALPLGVLEDAVFGAVELAHGDALVLYRRRHRDSGGGRDPPRVEGLLRSMEELRDGGAGAFLHALVEDFERRAAGRMRDDVAIAVLPPGPRVGLMRMSAAGGPGSGAILGAVTAPAVAETLDITSEATQLARARAWIASTLERHHVPRDHRVALVTAAGELCANAMKHAYAGAPGQPIHLTVRVAGDRSVVEVEDFGYPFDPARYAEPDLDSVPDLGLGIFIARRLTDECSFDTGRARGTRWTLVKYLQRQTLPG